MKTLLPNKIMFWELGLQYTFLRGGGGTIQPQEHGKGCLTFQGGSGPALDRTLILTDCMNHTRSTYPGPRHHLRWVHVATVLDLTFLLSELYWGDGAGGPGVPEALATKRKYGRRRSWLYQENVKGVAVKGPQWFCMCPYPWPGPAVSSCPHTEAILYCPSLHRSESVGIVVIRVASSLLSTLPAVSRNV